MTNELGQIVQYQAFTAFGEPIESLTQPAPPTPPLSRYGYAGAWGYEGLPSEQPDTEGFPYLHVGARYYDPEIGRFLQRDPIGIEGGLNCYVAVFNNPLNFVDPDGLAPAFLKSKKLKAAGVLLCATAGPISVGLPWVGAGLGAAGSLMWGGEDLWDGTEEVVIEIRDFYRFWADQRNRQALKYLLVPSEESRWQLECGGGS